MDDIFDEREQSEEAKYKLDQELQFKARSRRNKLLGLWAAGPMGLTSSEAEAYAKEVVLVDLEEAGDDDVVRKLMRDFANRQAQVTEAEVRTRMDELYAVALEQLAGEYPEPLGPDHRRVGD